MEVHAPYNFIPFPTQIIRRYDSVADLPAHDRLDRNLKSGEIRVTFEAKTPVFVSDGEKEHPDFYKNAAGEYEIPGSTVRGMLRETVQILGLGLIRPETEMEDYQIFFRDMASAKGGVKGRIHDYYEKVVMNVEHKKVNNKPVSNPRNVKAGYLYCIGKDYYIKSLGHTFYRISRGHPEMRKFEKNGFMPTAQSVSVRYQLKGDKVEKISRAKKTELRETTEGEWKEGTLLFTGPGIGKTKKNPFYLFPEADGSSDIRKIPEEDILSYQMDFENRKNQLKKRDFWNLPKGKEEKPVFWVEYNGHLYFGMTLFVRVGYPHSIAEGVPESHKTCLQEEEIFLDYPYSMFGFAEKERGAYRSRISVEGFVADGQENRKIEKRVLGSPKPGYFPGYLKNGAAYTDDHLELRGYKQYWMKNIQNGVGTDKDNVVSVLKPLPIGTRFTGVIHYKNLYEDELGLLLWAIRLENECYHQIGMGKPYGFGCIRTAKICLLEENVDELYSIDSLLHGKKNMESKETDAYIQKYKKTAFRKIDVGESIKKLDDLPVIKDFMFLHHTFQPEKGQINTSYMKLEDYKERTESLPTIEKYRAGEVLNLDELQKKMNAHREKQDRRNSKKWNKDKR